MNWFRRGVKVGQTPGTVANVLLSSEEYSYDIYFILLGRRNPRIQIMIEGQFTRIRDDEYERLMK